LYSSACFVQNFTSWRFQPQHQTLASLHDKYTTMDYYSDDYDSDFGEWVPERRDADFDAQLCDPAVSVEDKMALVLVANKRGDQFVFAHREEIKAFLTQHPEAMQQLLRARLHTKDEDELVVMPGYKWMNLFLNQFAKQQAAPGLYIPDELQMMIASLGGFDDHRRTFEAILEPCHGLMTHVLGRRLKWVLAEDIPSKMRFKCPDLVRLALGLARTQHDGAKIVSWLGRRHVQPADICKALECSVRDGHSSMEAVRALKEAAEVLMPAEFVQGVEFNVLLAKCNSGDLGLIFPEMLRHPQVLLAIAGTSNGAPHVWDLVGQHDDALYEAAAQVDPYILENCPDVRRVDLAKLFARFPRSVENMLQNRELLMLLDFTFEHAKVAVKAEAGTYEAILPFRRMFTEQEADQLCYLAASGANFYAIDSIPKIRLDGLVANAMKLHKSFAGLDWFNNRGKFLLPIPLAIVNELLEWVWDGDEADRYMRLVRRVQRRLADLSDEGIEADVRRYAKHARILTLMRDAVLDDLYRKPVVRVFDYPPYPLLYRPITLPKPPARAETARTFKFNPLTYKYESQPIVLEAPIVAPIVLEAPGGDETESDYEMYCGGAKRARDEDEDPYFAPDDEEEDEKPKKKTKLTKTEFFAHHAKMHAVGEHAGPIVRICNMRFPANLRMIFDQVNPKKPGSQAYARYEVYKRATTIGEFNTLTLGRWSALYFDFERGFVALG
jgi:hypothetical protein